MKSNREFVERLFYILDGENTDIKNKTVSEVVDCILEILRGDVQVGDITDLVYNRYVAEKIRDGLSLEKAQLREEAKTKLAQSHAKLESQFERRVQTAVELQGIYKVIKDKFMSDPSFLDYALLQIQRDVRNSKKKGDYPFLYKMTLEHCDKQQFIDSLISEHGTDLIKDYRQELKDELLKKYRSEILNEIKCEMTQETTIIDGMKNEIKRELIKKMFC